MIPVATVHRPLFLPSPQGPLMAQIWEPQAEVRGQILAVMPLGDEMNKSRRAVSVAARGMAASGFRVLLVDPRGMGDSWGDFEDLSWQGWLDDLATGLRCLQQLERGPVSLWAIRAGALALPHLATLVPVDGVLLWQPMVSGKVLVTQLLRLHTASSLVGGGKAADGGLDSKQLRARWQAGQAVEIGGYNYSASLALGLEAASLAPWAPAARLIWREHDAREQPALTPASKTQIAAWEQAGWQVDAQALQGPSFWTAVETESCPHLVSATLTALVGVAA